MRRSKLEVGSRLGTERMPTYANWLSGRWT
jgi:hypothetical protein